MSISVKSQDSGSLSHSQPSLLSVRRDKYEILININIDMEYQYEIFQSCDFVTTVVTMTFVMAGLMDKSLHESSEDLQKKLVKTVSKYF
jgi:hypothetical protein